jgi:hypothetical protein
MRLSTRLDGSQESKKELLSTTGAKQYRVVDGLENATIVLYAFFSSATIFHKKRIKE